MNKIHIKSAIESKAVFRCEMDEEFYLPDMDDDALIVFLLNITNFQKIDVESIDEIDEVSSHVNLGAADIYILQMVFSNLSKKAIKYYIHEQFTIIDQDGYEFKRLEDDHINLNSEFAEDSGLADSFAATFAPKIPQVLTLSFLLPKEENAEYYLDVDMSMISKINNENV